MFDVRCFDEKIVKIRQLKLSKSDSLLAISPIKIKIRKISFFVKKKCHNFVAHVPNF